MRVSAFGLTGLIASVFAGPWSPAGARTIQQQCQPSGDVMRVIERLERQLAAAVVARDYQSIQRIEAPDYVYTDSDSVVTNRDDFIKEYRAGSSTVKVFDFKDMVVHVVRDTAVVRGIIYVERKTNGRQIARSSRYTRVYVRQPDCVWQAIVGHSSLLK